MKLIGKIILRVIANASAIFIASTFVHGFIISGTWKDMLVIALIFMALNTFIRPIIKLFLGPLILITFGLFTIIINAGMLYFLDILNTHLTIEGYVALIMGTLVIGFANLAMNFGIRMLRGKK